MTGVRPMIHDVLKSSHPTLRVVSAGSNSPGEFRNRPRVVNYYCQFSNWMGEEEEKKCRGRQRMAGREEVWSNAAEMQREMDDC